MSLTKIIQDMLKEKGRRLLKASAGTGKSTGIEKEIEPTLSDRYVIMVPTLKLAQQVHKRNPHGLLVHGVRIENCTAMQEEVGEEHQSYTVKIENHRKGKLSLRYICDDCPHKKQGKCDYQIGKRKIKKAALIITTHEYGFRYVFPQSEKLKGDWTFIADENFKLVTEVSISLRKIRFAVDKLAAGRGDLEVKEKIEEQLHQAALNAAQVTENMRKEYNTKYPNKTATNLYCKDYREIFTEVPNKRPVKCDESYIKYRKSTDKVLDIGAEFWGLCERAGLIDSETQELKTDIGHWIQEKWRSINLKETLESLCSFGTSKTGIKVFKPHNSPKYIPQLYYTERVRLPENLIIMSATANMLMYESLIPDLKVFDAGIDFPIKERFKIATQRGKTSLKYVENFKPLFEILEQQSWYDKEKTFAVTSKDCSQHIPMIGANGITYGMHEGINGFRGKEIIVLGNRYTTRIDAVISQLLMFGVGVTEENIRKHKRYIEEDYMYQAAMRASGAEIFVFIGREKGLFSSLGISDLGFKELKGDSVKDGVVDCGVDRNLYDAVSLLGFMEKGVGISKKEIIMELGMKPRSMDRAWPKMKKMNVFEVTYRGSSREEYVVRKEEFKVQKNE